MTCAMGVLLALIERGASGKGQVIDCAMVSVLAVGRVCMRCDAVVRRSALHRRRWTLLRTWDRSCST
jgi:crotonobetainyl-CoA:carnitine CoA-transferase CaiB-like acyl-CoA transferase